MITNLPNHWLYVQSSGLYLSPANLTIYIQEIGYSGRAEGLNNPDKQYIRNLGPIPIGDYIIDWAEDFPDTVGPLAMRLIPQTVAQLRGRSGFLIHGDNSKKNFTASHGCIILTRATRTATNNSAFRLLRVITGRE